MTKYFKVSKKAATTELNITHWFGMIAMAVLAVMMAKGSWMEYHREAHHGAAFIFGILVLLPLGAMGAIYSMWKERREKLAALPDGEPVVIKYPD